MSGLDKIGTKSFLRKWVSALRSGDYVQSTGRLAKKDGTFCCLGVACEVAGLRKRKGGDDCFMYSGGLVGALPDDAADLLAEVGIRQWDLIFMNDRGVSFPEIADKIEAAAGLKRSTKEATSNKRSKR